MSYKDYDSFYFQVRGPKTIVSVNLEDSSPMPKPFDEVVNIQATVLDSLNGFVIIQKGHNSSWYQLPLFVGYYFGQTKVVFMQ